MKLEAAREASRIHTGTSSCGSPKRLAGVCSKMVAVRSLERIFRFCSAGKKPGISRFTLNFSPYSRAKFWLRLERAAFDEPYMKTLLNGESPVMLPTLMIEPLVSVKAGTKAWQHRAAKKKFLSKMSTISASSISAKGVDEFTPTPLTSTSTLPKRSTTSSRTAPGVSGNEASAAMKWKRSASRSPRTAAAFASDRPTITTVAPAS
mmetsp:Transcript_18305/g.38391  ORF Transcript_18305/g.38391 Transcript_18305/m.38391 type:complete len:206 (+) Transcript_18305:262-879(+)